MRRLALVSALSAAPIALASACGGGGDFVVVTIETRPAVHDVTELVVALTNDGTTLEDRFPVTTETFPATFAVDVTGRTGQLDIDITAFDRDALLVGHGLGAAQIEAAEATVLVDSADFVVNTDFPEDQFPSDDFDAHGFQIGATDDGVFTVVYRPRCFEAEGCNMFARRFDVTGRPVESALAASTNGFPVSSDRTTGVATPAVASAGSSTVVVWDFNEPSPGTVDGIACRAIDATGNAVGPQVAVSIEALADVVSVAPLANATFVVSWNGFDANDTIKGAIVNSQCQPSGLVQVSQNAGVGGADRGAVTANGERILYAWILDGDVRGRLANSNNTFVTADIPLVGKTATDIVEYVRVAPLGDGFAVVVRWVLANSTTGPGRIELYRTNNGGQLLGGPTLITTRSSSDFLSSQGFGVASRDDGALLVTWHSCDENGDDSGCGVFGRVVRPNGVPVGDELVIPTSTIGNQENPSAVGLPGGAFAVTWMDSSMQSPDRSGSAVRARVIYPPYDDARGVIGAACAATSECGEGLTCGPSSDGGKRCFASCDPTGVPPLCPGGGTCTVVAEGGAACLF